MKGKKRVTPLQYALIKGDIKKICELTGGKEVIPSEKNELNQNIREEDNSIFQERVSLFKEINQKSEEMLKQGIEYSKYKCSDESSEDEINILETIKSKEEQNMKQQQKKSSNSFFSFFCCCFNTPEDSERLYLKNEIN